MDAFLKWWETNPGTNNFFSFHFMGKALPVIVAAFPVSIIFGTVSFFLAIPAGLILAFMKISRRRFVRWPATLYVDIVRGTPLFLQILIIFFGVPLLPFYRNMVVANMWMKDPFLFGIDATYFLRGLVVLSFNSAAYMAEIFRAGIQSIPKGQMEASRSLGMSISASMFYVIIPQTIRRILPTMMSEFILLFKDTALLATVGVAEMTMRARQANAATFNQSAYMVAAAFYLIVTVPLGRFVAALEDRLAVSEGGGPQNKRDPLVPAPIDSEHVVPHANLISTNERRGGN